MNIEDIYNNHKLKMIKQYSTESNCFHDNNNFYKIYKNNIDVNQRMKTIEIFKENKINGCPVINDYIYGDENIIGYVMKYYKKAKPFYKENKYEFIRQKCLELINIYNNLKSNYNLCYFDFHKQNVFINDNHILLLDVDSSLNYNPRIDLKATHNLIDYIVSMIYKTIFFDYEAYYQSHDRDEIRAALLTYDNNYISTLDDVEYFVNNITKKEAKKYLKKIPYSIKK